MQSPPPSRADQRSQQEQRRWVRHPDDQTSVPRGISILVGAYSTLFRSSHHLVVQIEDKYIYDVDIARLRQHAVALDEIFSIPSDLPLDGTPSHPVAIPHITGQEFSHFTNWFNQPFSRSRIAS